MMALTPDEILNHDFTKKGSRAYIASEVDAFLDQVNGDYEAIIAERDRFANEKEQLQVKVDELEAKREQVNQSIFVAQEAAERLKKDADAEVKKQLMHAQESATKIISDARTKAAAEATKLAQENADLVAEQNELRQEVESFKDSFLKLLTVQRTLLDNDELAEAVHRLPMGQATAARIEKAGVNSAAEAATNVADEIVDDAATSDTTVEQGPVVVFPETEDTADNKS